MVFLWFSSLFQAKKSYQFLGHAESSSLNELRGGGAARGHRRGGGVGHGGRGHLKEPWSFRWKNCVFFQI